MGIYRNFLMMMHLGSKPNMELYLGMVSQLPRRRRTGEATTMDIRLMGEDIMTGRHLGLRHHLSLMKPLDYMQ
jgi:hypothetical protein